MFYKSNKNLDLPINLWGHPKSPGINHYMCDAEFFTVADLPKILNKIDYKTIENKCALNKKWFSPFLIYHHLQTAFSSALSSITPGLHLV